MELTVGKKKLGRPTDYKPEYAEQAAKLCALGATDNDLADFFGVSEQTIYTWRKKYGGTTTRCGPTPAWVS